MNENLRWFCRAPGKRDLLASYVARFNRLFVHQLPPFAPQILLFSRDRHIRRKQVFHGKDPVTELDLDHDLLPVWCLNLQLEELRGVHVLSQRFNQCSVLFPSQAHHRYEDLFPVIIAEFQESNCAFKSMNLGVGQPVFQAIDVRFVKQVL